MVECARIWSKERRKNGLEKLITKLGTQKKSVGTKIKEEVMKEYGNKEINEKIEEQSETRRKELKNDEWKQTK